MDYKVFCFNGEPKFLYVSKGLENHETASISYLSLDWKFEPFERTDYKPFGILPPKPACLNEMLSFSKILANGIPFVRCDFYDVCGKTFFSELTFYPGAGFTKFKPDEFDAVVGDMLAIKTK